MSEDVYTKIALEIKTSGVWDPKHYSVTASMYQADQNDEDGQKTVKNLESLLSEECNTVTGSYSPENRTIKVKAEECKVPQIGVKEPMNSAKKLIMIAENAEGCTVSHIPFTLNSTSCNATGIGSLYKQLDESQDQFLKSVQALFTGVAELSNKVQSGGGEATLQTKVNLDLSSRTEYVASTPAPVTP